MVFVSQYKKINSSASPVQKYDIFIGKKILNKYKYQYLPNFKRNFNKYVFTSVPHDGNKKASNLIINQEKKVLQKRKLIKKSKYHLVYKNKLTFPKKLQQNNSRLLNLKQLNQFKRQTHNKYFKYINKRDKPVCKFFLEGKCTKSYINCPYLHVKYNPHTHICLPFIKGQCNLGEKCPKRHCYECPEFVKFGKCPTQSTCPFKHDNFRKSKIYVKSTSHKLKNPVYYSSKMKQYNNLITDAASYRTKAQALSDKIRKKLDILSEKQIESSSSIHTSTTTIKTTLTSPIRCMNRSSNKTSFPTLPSIIKLSSTLMTPTQPINADLKLEHIIENDPELMAIFEKYENMDIPMLFESLG